MFCFDRKKTSLVNNGQNMLDKWSSDAILLASIGLDVYKYILILGERILPDHDTRDLLDALYSTPFTAVHS